MSEPAVRVCRVPDVVVEAGVLTAAEVRRWQRLVQQVDRDAYVAAHVLVRQVAAEVIGSRGVGSLTLLQSCPDCGGADHGRPAIAGHPDVHVSFSHARGVVAAVAAAAPCGIDVETHRIHGVPAGTLTAREQSWVDAQPDSSAAFTRLWTRKEAWAKATGEGLDRAIALDVLDVDWVTGELQTEEYGAAWVVL